MLPLISLIIPVYNPGILFVKCMESVLHQTYSNFEVILIDDGSTDGTEMICDKYEAQDSRVKVFHKKNEGQSIARNFGVLKSNGEYIAFVDSDDIVEETYLEYLYYLLKKYTADISCAKIEKKKTEYIEILNTRNRVCTEKDFSVSVGEAIKMMCQENIVGVSPCAKLYKKDILLKVPYPDGEIYEDLATTCKIFGICSVIAVGSKTVYYYVQSAESTIRGVFKENQFSALLAATEQLNYIIKYFPDAEHEARIRCANTAIALISRILLIKDKKQGKKYFVVAKKYYMEYAKDDMIAKSRSISYKIRCRGVMLGYYPAKKIWRIIDGIKKLSKRSRNCT